MRKTITILLILFAKEFQAQVYSWVATAKVKYEGSGTGAFSAWDLELDRNGNSYVTGALTGTAYSGYDTIYGGSGPNNHTSYTSKISKTGQVIWAKRTYGHKSYGVGVDYVGNCYTAGSIQGGNMFVEKLDSLGNSLWTLDLQGNSTIWDYVTDLVTDSAGNSYVTGYFFNTITIGTYTLNNTGSSFCNVFLTKINTNGNVLWAKQIGGINSSIGVQEIILDKKSNIYITGYFSGLTDFGGTILTDSTTADIYIAKYDSTGNLILANSVLKYTIFSGQGVSLNSMGIVTDDIGNVYLTGYFFGKLTAGSYSIQSTTTAVDNDIFVAKINPNGQGLWLRKAGTIDNDQAWSIALDECQNVWISGQIQGCFGCQAIFDTQTYNSPSSTINSFVAKYSNNGTIQDVKTSTSNLNEQISSMRIAPYGNVVVAGNFGLIGSSITDTIEFDTCDFVSMADTNYLYVAQINNCSMFYNNLINDIPSPLCEGTSLTLTSGNPNTYWYDGRDGLTIVVNNDVYAWADITTCNGCINRDTLNVQFTKLPIANFTSNINSNVVSFSNSSSFATTYSWDFGDTQTSTLSNPNHTYTTNGTYTVTLTAINICDSSLISYILTINTTEISNQHQDILLVYPTIVQNGKVTISGLDLSKSNFKLVNVMGQIIHENHVNLSNEIELPENISIGVYYLIIDSNGSLFSTKILVQK